MIGPRNPPTDILLGPKAVPIPALHPPPKASYGTRGLRFLLAMSVLASLGLVVFAVSHALARRPACILLVAPRSATLDPSQREALGTLIQDHLECLGGLPVANAQEIPSNPGLAAFPPRTLLLVPTLSRREDRLSVAFSFAWLSELRRDPVRCWRESPRLEGSPAPTLHRALEGLPLPLSRSNIEHLLPARDNLFWELIQGQAWHRDDSRLDAAQALGARVTAVEPGCASAWTLQGDVLYRRLLNDPRGYSEDQREAESHFAKALRLLPSHPRGTFLLAELRIDSGDQRTALAGLQGAIRHFPRVAALYSGLAYAARTAGLLELARRALARRDMLCPLSFSQYTSENTYLYLGDRRRFEESLVEMQGNPRNVLIHFYRGYLALAAGDRRGARDSFLAAGTCGEGLGQFQQLSQVFLELTSGRDREALQSLRQLEKARAGLRVPDGEFTFKMGEAYALLGQRDAALDMLSRAFSQGFGCTRWYKESPFLGSLREMPRWRALLLHVQERQQIFESRFPPSEFGL